MLRILVGLGNNLVRNVIRQGVKMVTELILWDLTPCSSLMLCLFWDFVFSLHVLGQANYSTAATANTLDSCRNSPETGCENRDHLGKPMSQSHQIKYCMFYMGVGEIEEGSERGAIEDGGGLNKNGAIGSYI